VSGGVVLKVQHVEETPLSPQLLGTLFTALLGLFTSITRSLYLPFFAAVALVLKRPAVPASSSRTSATEPIDSMPTVAITLQATPN
jgi:hypothetical protein